MIKSEQKLEIVVPKLNLGILKVQVIGKTPLLMDRFPDEVYQQVLDKQVGKGEQS